MPPKKVAEKSEMIMDLKQRKGLRKKTPTAKSLMGETTFPTIEMLISDDDNQDPENVPLKITKAKVARKVNLNGLKPVRAYKGKLNKAQALSDIDLPMIVASEEQNNSEDGPQKTKKAKVLNKQNHTNHGDGAIDLLYYPEDILPKNNRTKLNKHNQKPTETVDHAEDKDNVANPGFVATKIRKPRAPRIKKQMQNEIKIVVLDEATGNTPIPEEASKGTKIKANYKQNPKNIHIIITKANDSPDSVDKPPESPVDVPPKIKKTKSPYKQNQNDIKILFSNEVIKNAMKKTPPIVSNPRRNRRPKRSKTILNGDNVTDVNIEPNKLSDSFVISEATEEIASSSAMEEVPKKKGKYTLKRKIIAVIDENVQNIATVYEASVDEPPHKPVEVPPKIKRTKSAYKQNQNDIKILLANEVIRNAFKKQSTIVSTPHKQARPRRNKTIGNADDNVKDVNLEANKLTNTHDTGDIQDVAKKKSIKKSCTSTLEAHSQEFPLSATSESPGTEEGRKKRSKLSLKRKTTTVVDQNTDTINEGKKEIQKSEPIDNSAALLISNQTTVPDSTSKTDCETQLRKGNNLSSRKNSDTSTSTCFAWTKDISSSSNSTFIAVKSTDFVRIDKKLPIIKLNNVDDEVKRRKHLDNIFEENTFDSFQHKSKCPSERSNVSIGTLNAYQPLNLSTSSLTSVGNTNHAQNNHVNKENKDGKILKLQRSLENLSSKIKNFDLEIINWIGHENDSNQAKLKNFHARIFEMLNDENDVIRYCKQIKRVLVGDQQSNAVIAECPNEDEELHHQQAGENLPINNPPTNVRDDSEEQTKSMFEPDSESKKDRDTEENLDNPDEIINESKSFDKNEHTQDNDDDDALSLFAESITGLESSRKNSSLGVFGSNDKNVTQPDLRESRVNERSIERISLEDFEEQAPHKGINSVKKQTADSSTVLNRASDNDVVIKFQINNSEPSVNILDHFNDKCNIDDIGVSYKRFQHINDNVINNNVNKTLFNSSVEFRDNRARSPMNTCEISSNRSPEFENCRGRTFPYSLDNDSLNLSQDISGITGNNIFENWNNNTSFTQDYTNADFIEQSDNSYLGNPTLEQHEQSVANQLAMTNKQIFVAPSTIFRGICIFYLVSKCKNIKCNFPHKRLEIEIVRAKLQEMKEKMFIKESMYLFKWSILKRKYGKCFVEECIRRNLTIWLLHLVKEFISKVNRNHGEEGFATEIIEATLLHLNEANMEPCGDILRSKIRPNICFCDHLMKAISETQNFSRFKNVFIKLTLFMCQNGRSFSLDVATQLLERLCILPYDDPLARALIKIITKTNPSIFNVAMMRLLENQLSKNNAILYKELMSLKLQAQKYNQNLASPPMQSPHVASTKSGLQTSTPIARADSPDTTNTDFVNKTSEPVITRTITINRTINTNQLDKSAGSESSEEPPQRFEARRPQSTWRRFSPAPAPLRHRQVYKRPVFAPRAFSGGLPKFRRRPPQEPY